MKYSDNNRGYTMIETIMYVGILIVLGGVLASYAHKTMDRYKIGRTVQQITELKKAIMHFTATDEDYSNVSIENMVKHYSLPLDMRTGDSRKAAHALGGMIEIGPASHAPLLAEDENKNHMFFIKFDNLEKDSCVEILTQGQFYGDGSELDTLIVNGSQAWRFPISFYDTTKFSGAITSVHEFSWKCIEGGNDLSTCTKTKSIRFTISEAMRACTKKNDNDIIWIFS